VSKDAKTARARHGRPPAGLRPGEHVSRYPQLTTRVPRAVVDRLQVIAKVTRKPQWRVLAEAVEAYVRHLPADERALLDGMLGRATTVLAKPKSTRAIATPAPIQILNVDDNDAMLFARSKLLRAEGFEVLEAQTGRRALEMVERYRPPVVLLDVRLPDISGLDVCRQIKSDSRLAGIKIVQTSATFSSPHDQLEGLKSGGADFYLAEPVPRGTLLSVIRRLLA
jgi:CheY-like chemotaxis protein